MKVHQRRKISSVAVPPVGKEMCGPKYKSAKIKNPRIYVPSFEITLRINCSDVPKIIRDASILDGSHVSDAQPQCQSPRLSRSRAHRACSEIVESPEAARLS